ncbi:MAG: hypothetical protein HUU02_02150 [Bacteroidetes bacterium]|nr:hypothetical protein [Bacteroidota bacterium]
MNDRTLPGDILRTVTYFDLFAYPVTEDQIYAFLQRNSVTREDVRDVAEGLVEEGRLARSGEYYFLADRPASAAAERRNGEREAERMLTIARSVARLMKRVPFIRAVFITGSLSKSIADRKSDIDFMIVTAPGRLWIVRSLLTLIRKLFLLGSRKYFCTNYYVTENGFPLRRRNLYTAIETVTVKPVWDDGSFERFQEQNAWTRDFLPNMHPAADPALLIAPRHSLLQRITERLLELLPLDAADTRLMEVHRSHWMNVYRHLDKERLASMFIITPDVSASWPEDRQVPVLTRYHERLTAMGLH